MDDIAFEKSINSPDFHSDFAALLLSTYIAEYEDNPLSRNKINNLRNWIKGNLPASLYRYRTVTEYSLRALDTDEIWGSVVDAFNDPFEWLPCYDQVTLSQNVCSQLQGDAVAEQLKWAAKGRYAPDFIAATTPEIRKLFTKELQKFSDFSIVTPIVDNARIGIVNEINQNIQAYESDFFSHSYLEQHKRYVACLSEDYQSTLMWGHYADSHRGFALEYDFSSLITDCSNQCANSYRCENFGLNLPIAPVIYQDSKFDATVLMTAFIMKDIFKKLHMPAHPVNYDCLYLIKCLLVKALPWAYEKEWRLFSKQKKEALSNQFGCIAVLKPKAVYLGNKMNIENQNKISEICKRKDIVCQRMMLNFSQKDFQMFPYPVDK